MTDASTKQPLRVSDDGLAGPYIMVPVAQLDDLRRQLDRHRVPYDVDEDAIALNDEPEVAVVNLGREASVSRVQAILDSTP